MAASEDLEHGLMRSHRDSEKPGEALSWTQYAALLLNRRWLPERAPGAFASALESVYRQARAGDATAAGILDSATPETLALAARCAERWGERSAVACGLVVIEARRGSTLREFADFCATLMRWYWSEVGRGHVYLSVADCSFHDDPLTVLSEEARKWLRSELNEPGSELAGRACGQCAERYGESLGNMPMVRLSESGAPAIGRLSTGASSDALSDALSLANRGVLAMDAECLDNLYTGGAARDAVLGAPLSLSGELVWPDMILAVETEDASLLPDWVYGAALIWRDRPPESVEEERDLARVYDVRRGLSAGRLHVGPLAHEMMAYFGRAFRLGSDTADAGRWVRPSEIARMCADASLDEGCLTHSAAFRTLGEVWLSEAEGASDRDAELFRLSGWLYEKIVWDIARARAADGERSYERIAAERLASGFLLPLGIVKAAERGGLPQADERMAELGQYETRLLATGRNGAQGEVRIGALSSVWDEIYDSYSRECDELALSGWSAVDPDSDGAAPAKVDLETLRYDRHMALGALIDSEFLPRPEALAQELHQDGSSALSARLGVRLVRDYGYCAACSADAIETVASGSGPYVKSMVRQGGLSGLLGAKREIYRWKTPGATRA